MGAKVVAMVEPTGRCLLDTDQGLAVVDLLAGELALNDTLVGTLEASGRSTMLNLTQGALVEVWVEISHASMGLARMLLGLV